MIPKSKVSKLAYVAASITVVAIIGIFLFIKNQELLRDDKYLGLELFKLSYQFLLLIVVGGAVSLLFTLYTKEREILEKSKEREREKREKLKEKEEMKNKEEKSLQRKFYADFVQAYNDVKKVRRFLKARGRIISNKINSQAILIKTVQYDELMKDLTVLQLKFEFFYDDLASNTSLFSGSGCLDILKNNIEIIEKYLNEIVTEYEECFRLYPDQSYIDDITTIPICNLPKLDEFLKKHKVAGDFLQKFKYPADEVYARLLNLLTSTNC